MSNSKCEMWINTEVELSAGHYLPRYIGKCGKIHGHNWILKMKLYGKQDEKTGMIIDFGDIKTILKERYDHCCMNDIIENPTAENLIQDIGNFIIKRFGIRKMELELSETEKNKVGLYFEN